MFLSRTHGMDLGPICTVHQEADKKAAWSAGI